MLKNEFDDYTDTKLQQSETMSLKEICDNIDKCRNATTITEMKSKSDQIRRERDKLLHIIDDIAGSEIQCIIYRSMMDIVRDMFNSKRIVSDDEEINSGITARSIYSNNIYDSKCNMLLGTFVRSYIMKHFDIDNDDHIDTHVQLLAKTSELNRLQQQQEIDATKHREKIDMLEKLIDTRDNEIIMLNESTGDCDALREKIKQHDSTITSLKEENKMLSKCHQNLLDHCNDTVDKLSDVIIASTAESHDNNVISYKLLKLRYLMNKSQKVIDANMIIRSND